MSQRTKYSGGITWLDVENQLAHMRHLTGWIWEMNLKSISYPAGAMRISFKAYTPSLERAPEPSYEYTALWHPRMRPDLAPVAMRVLHEAWADLHGSPWNWSPLMRKTNAEPQG